MDECLGEMECRYKSDSIMMRLLRAAMDKAHKKVQSKDGPIECLHERSKFYEFAIIQIKGSLKLIQEETDSSIPETSREKMLADLMELQSLLQGRLKETKHSIIKKDKELNERLENELKLRQALESKERELLHLRANLEVERRTKSKANRDESKEGDIRELKNSVDQQVWNIKQRLEDERKNLTSGVRKTSSNIVDLKLDYELLYDDKYSCTRVYSGTSHKIEMMQRTLTWPLCNDGIHKLRNGPKKYSCKESKEHEFCGDDYSYNSEIKLKNDSLRTEQKVVIEQMSSDIDFLKGTLDLAFGRMQNAEARPLEKQWRCKIEKETALILIKGFMSDLKQNLEDGFENIENDASIGLSNENWKEFFNELTRLYGDLKDLVSSGNEVQGKTVEGHDRSSPLPQVRRTISEPLPDVDFTEDFPEEEKMAADGNNYVAKMIKNHESIIRKQTEELQYWLKTEETRGKGYSSVKRNKELDGLKRRIREVTVRLKSVIKWRGILGAKISTCDVDYFLEKRISKHDIPKLEKIVSIDYDVDLEEEIRKVKQERDFSNWQNIAMEETYSVLFKGLVKDFYLELHNYEAENFIREEIYYTICSEALKGCVYNHRFRLVESQSSSDKGNEENSTSSKSLFHYLETTLREDIYGVFFKEMVKEWNNRVENQDAKSLVDEEIYRIISDETIKNIGRTTNMALSQHEENNIENLLKEDVYMVFLREMVKAWKMERDANNTYNQDSGSEKVSSAKDLVGSSEHREEESLIQKLDHLLRCSEVEENLTLRSSLEMEDHNANHGLASLECEGHDQDDTNEWLLTEDDSSFNIASNKLEKARQQLVASKELLKDLEYSLGIGVDELEEVDDPVNPIIGVVHGREQTICQPEESQIVLFSTFDFLSSSLIGFQQLLINFEDLANVKLERNCLRLQELKHQMEPHFQLMASMRKKELVYKKAFMRRCHNLRLAETEVDLLGDQVDVLLGLLEKIYLILNQFEPVLSHHFGVMGIIKLIKEELTARAPRIPNL